MREDITKYLYKQCIHYSLLSALNKHPRNLLATEKSDTDELSFGSLVDCLMFTPEDLDERFYITDISKPGDKMGAWLNAYMDIEIPPDYTLADTDKLILKARAIVGYNANLTDTKALDKFHAECDDYMNVIAKAGDKTIITQDTLSEAIAYQAKLLTNPFTSKYFQSMDKNWEVKFQVPIYYTIDGQEAKSLLDIVIIDHYKKQIFGVDLKTTSKPLDNFESDFVYYGYYLQAALYSQGLALSSFRADNGLDDYTCMPDFFFIVINSFEEPMLWHANQSHINVGLVGGITRNGTKIKGIHQLIDEYLWHQEMQVYDYRKSVYLNGGVRDIDMFV